MIIYAIILIKNNGTPILTQYFQSEEDMPDISSLGRLLHIVKGFTNEILHEDMKTIKLESLAYHIKYFGLFSIVAITNVSDRPSKIIWNIGFRFMKDFGEDLVEKDVRIDKFVPFKETISNIIKSTSFDESCSIKPSKVFSTSDMFDLPVDLQKIALTMIFLGEASLKDILKEVKLDEKEIAPKLNQLLKLGYLGKKARNNEIIFFCRTI